MLRAVPLLVAAFLPAGDTLPAVDFNREIRPLLAEKCLLCHGPDEAVREADLRLDQKASALADRGGYAAVVPGKAQASELYLRISDPDDPMPPRKAEKPLSPEEIVLVKRWIDEGADWREHWAYVAPVRRPPPAVADAGSVRDPLDLWVRARLEAEGLAPAPEAAPAELLRRVSFDLTGLPPTLDELDRFLADREPGAYERAVERLLASPRYGEHMARYWLDAARYGDTHGFHFDNERSLWRWRDWVIAAFNANQPFDAFAVEQLAGDLLPEPTLDQLVATGFNRCNPTTGEGGLIDEEYRIKYAVDRVSTVSTVFLGTTLACAACHDHKYDPFSQREFYGLLAYFNSFAEEASDGNALAPPPSLAAPTRAQAARLEELAGGLAAVDARMSAPLPALDVEQAAWEEEEARGLSARWHALAPLAAASRQGATLSVQADGSVLASGANPDTDVFEVVAQTDAALIGALHLETLPDPSHARGGVPTSGRSPNGNSVLTGIELEAAPRGRGAGFALVALATADADVSQAGFPVEGALSAGDAETGWALNESQTESHRATFALAEPLALEGGALLRVRLTFASSYAQHTLGRFRLSVSTEPARRAVFGPWSSAGPFAAASADEAYTTDFGPEAHPESTAWEAHPEHQDGAPLALPGGDNAAVYLARTVQAPSGRRIELALGSDDALKVWLNGVLVLERNVRRPLAPDQDRVALHLPAGESRLLVKVVNAQAGFGFQFRVSGEELFDVPVELGSALAAPAAARGADDRALLLRAFRAERWADWPALSAEREGLAGERARVLAQVPQTMITRDRPVPRPTHVLARGQYDQPGAEVAPGVPAVLPPLQAGAPANRLALARWLTAPDHPLTARVTVNRFWQQVFGRGLVDTPEDFGTRGSFPSHPELLDELALDFVASGWDVKGLMRRLVTSATYRQASAVPEELRARDPHNRLLGRGSRYRLDAEELRDQALLVSGLLSEELGGPSVRPYQPGDLWKVVAYPTSNTASFVQDAGAKLYRRSLYTFWKRTAPPPSLALFDAPGREACAVRRARTNTPLQALALMNDVQLVEAARALAARLLLEPEDDDARLVRGFRAVTARAPDEGELGVLRSTLAGHRAAYAADPAAAQSLIEVGDSEPDARVAPAELAAWTLLANLLLNLDEALTKG